MSNFNPDEIKNELPMEDKIPFTTEAEGEAESEDTGLQPLDPGVVKRRVKTPLNLREKPSKSAKILQILNTGDEVVVKKDCGEWIEVENGFCMKEFTEKI